MPIGCLCEVEKPYICKLYAGVTWLQIIIQRFEKKTFESVRVWTKYKEFLGCTAIMALGPLKPVFVTESVVILLITFHFWVSKITKLPRKC